jgi:hypothetical protein
MRQRRFPAAACCLAIGTFRALQEDTSGHFAAGQSGSPPGVPRRATDL